MTIVVSILSIALLFSIVIILFLVRRYQQEKRKRLTGEKEIAAMTIEMNKFERQSLKITEQQHGIEKEVEILPVSKVENKESKDQNPYENVANVQLKLEKERSKSQSSKLEQKQQNPYENVTNVQMNLERERVSASKVVKLEQKEQNPYENISNVQMNLEKERVRELEQKEQTPYENISKLQMNLEKDRVRELEQKNENTYENVTKVQNRLEKEHPIPKLPNLENQYENISKIQNNFEMDRLSSQPNPYDKLPEVLKNPIEPEASREYANLPKQQTNENNSRKSDYDFLPNNIQNDQHQYNNIPSSKK